MLLFFYGGGSIKLILLVMKIVIETDGAITKCEVDSKNIKDCDVLTKRLVFNAFNVIKNVMTKKR